MASHVIAVSLLLIVAAPTWERSIAQAARRPAGVADIEGSRVDVVSDGGFIEAGAAIEVTRVEGNRVVVRERPVTEHGDRNE
jgi:membrane-bound ClpP family serine protease